METKQAPAPEQLIATLLPESLFEYLAFVFKQHVANGLPVEELHLANELHKRLSAAQPVDFSSLGKMKVDAAAPGSLALSTQPDSPREDGQPLDAGIAG